MAPIPQAPQTAPTKPEAAGRAGSSAASSAPAPEFAPPIDRLDASGPGGLNALLNTEWLLTNGLGGFAMGTCSGVPARRYHGLLVAAANPPLGRVMTLNAMAESIVASDEPGTVLDLCSFRFGGAPLQPAVIHPSGTTRLRRFEQDQACRWLYEVRERGFALEVVKELHLLDRENAAQLRYRVRRLDGDSGKGFRLRARPLVSLRDAHGLIRRSWADRFSFAGSSDGVRIEFAGQPVQLHMRSDRARFAADVQWWDTFFYEFDAERAQDCFEDLYSPGEFTLAVEPKQLAAECIVQASITPMALADGARDLRVRRDRLQGMHHAATGTRGAGTGKGAGALSPADNSTVSALLAASDAFVVARRSPGTGELDQASVIAGYPWFGDWGRDTSISLLGLMLATGRLDEARRTLLAFASHRHNGIVPNVFNEQTGEPEYNTVDASLWFILGACAFRKAGGDRATWDGHLAPACLDIIAHYRRGTDFNIAMDPLDKLITAGTSATQLTWMDAKRDGVTFTPRQGKAVEINALWHSALCELGEATRDTDATLAANLRDLAETVARSFRSLFWNAKLGCLYDTLSPADGSGPGWTPVADIRPNQLFAVSLAHSPLSIEQQRAVVVCVRERLLTPYGVRTLDPADARYQGRYEGNLFERDRAYHNGTAWPWLLGPYAEAVLRVGGFSDQAKREARGALEPILAEMHSSPSRSGGAGPRGCVGQIAEIYDGSAPQRPQGCPAQAWSIAEALRVFLMIA